MTRGALTDQIHRTDATLSETGQYEPMTHNPIRLRIMAITGTRYILEHKDEKADQVLGPLERFPKNVFTLAWENDQWRIWEYTHALPRAFVVHKTVVETNSQKIIDILLNEQTNLHVLSVVEEQGAHLDGPENDTDTVEILRYEPSTIDFRVNTQTDGLLFLSDTYYPGWRAFVDGVEAKIYRTNYTFRGVLVPRGEHTVHFVYDPFSWKVGLSLSGIGLVAFIIFVTIKKRKHA